MEWIFIAASYVVGGAVVAAMAWKQIDHKIRRKKLVTIASLTDDRSGRVAGTVKQLHDLVEAGATGRPCVLYRVEIRRFTDLPNSRASTCIAEEIGGTPFVLDDSTGTAVVDPRGAKLGFLRSDAWSDPGTFLQPTPRTDAILARHGYPNPPTVWRYGLHVREAIIVPGDRIEVHGAGVRDADPDGAEGYRTTGTRVHMVGSAKSELWIVKPE